MSDDDLLEASPCKLRNGNWGCKTDAPVQVGDTVRIVTRANKQWQARITQVVWTDDTVCICETESLDKRGAPKDANQSGARTTRQQSKAKTPSSDATQTAPDDGALGTPAYTADMPPTGDSGPSDELDAMADRVAAEDDETDEWLAAFDELERDGNSDR
ncbi:hypothetical protein [Salinisphaera sp. Q1T1-3]|uniref:hypothetical protein n=1 Tax=Salinisphaera sp. Q1T1-3 TaxID=2321229 RepID=UPI0011C49C80|nr:hypothetical protein [Salinisphaera sp. Q1T1-3]